MPTSKMESRSVTETLDFREKKIVLEEKRCRLFTENFSRLQRNSEMAQVLKEQGQLMLSQDRVSNEIVTCRRK